MAVASILNFTKLEGPVSRDGKTRITSVIHRCIFNIPTFGKYCRLGDWMFLFRTIILAVWGTIRRRKPNLCAISTLTNSFAFGCWKAFGKCHEGSVQNYCWYGGDRQTDAGSGVQSARKCCVHRNWVQMRFILWLCNHLFTLCPIICRKCS